MGIETKQCWSVFLKLKVGLKLRVCAKLSAFCGEYNGDGEDARRPFSNLSNNINNLQSHMH
eukprot:9183751-Heterocapsa_arctica.AAC.1